MCQFDKRENQVGSSGPDGTMLQVTKEKYYTSKKKKTKPKTQPQINNFLSSSRKKKTSSSSSLMVLHSDTGNCRCSVYFLCEIFIILVISKGNNYYVSFQQCIYFGLQNQLFAFLIIICFNVSNDIIWGYSGLFHLHYKDSTAA